MIQEALKFAVEKHEKQLRKGTNIPYIVHPVEVMKILLENGATEQVVVAGILHDTVEDTKTTIDELKIVFGDEIAKIVAGVSEDKTKTWEERKQHTIVELKNATKEIKLVACADKLSNLKSIFHEKNEIGKKIWERFKRGFKPQKKYYSGLIDSLSDLGELKMYLELKNVFINVFENKII
ncbi:MAG: HD domain-containing protein [Clostridia bacterium]